MQSLLTWIPAFREVDLEPSAKRGGDRTKGLMSLYCSSQRNIRGGHFWNLQAICF